MNVIELVAVNGIFRQCIRVYSMFEAPPSRSPEPKGPLALLSPFLRDQHHGRNSNPGKVHNVLPPRTGTHHQSPAENAVLHRLYEKNPRVAMR